MSPPADSSVRSYTSADRDRWNAFVSAAKNATFLFDRGYMDYHAERFPDASVMVEDGQGRLCAVLPASRTGEEVVSHGGLTYGGLLLAPGATVAAAGRWLTAVAGHLAAAGCTRLVYKTVPHIYHRQPAEEDRYWLFRCGAELVRRDLLTVIAPGSRAPLQTRRARALKRAERAGVEVGWTTDFGPFWDVLAENLRDRYGVEPVHSLAEIELLSSRFPDRIRLATARIGDTTVAGAVVYISERVVHVQYNAANADGRSVGGLDAVLNWLLDRPEAAARHFDFGVSTESAGTLLNEGLVEYKESFGGRSVVQDFYGLDPRTVAGL